MRAFHSTAVGAIVATAALALFAVSTATAQPTAAPTQKPPIPPGIPPQQADQAAAAARARELAYLQEFNVQGRDPRSLPRRNIDAVGDLPTSLQAAARRADLIIRGSVAKTTYAPDPGGGLPIATSSVTVSTTLKQAGPTADTVLVVQAGGPVPVIGGGALAQLDIDELVLPGDEVFLLLVKREDLGAYKTIPGAGVFFVRAGAVSAEEHNLFGRSVNGQSASAFSATLSLLAR